MKKIILSAFSVALIGTLVFISCKPKNDSSAITPTYKDEATGTGANPATTQVTTTGTVATTSTANQNSALTVGGSSWNTPGCTPGQITLTGSNGSTNTTVTMYFSAPPTSGTYTTVATNAPTAGRVFIQVNNPPSQPTGSVWNSTAGLNVIVTVTGSQINASFSNVTCVQSGSSFPVVTISGNVGCI
jgi:hypothetical protein